MNELSAIIDDMKGKINILKIISKINILKINHNN